MSVHKVIEIMAQSDRSWDDAAQQAVTEAARSVRGIKSIYVKNMEAVVENERITAYRLNAKITFEVDK